jgi:hypothetical protein
MKKILLAFVLLSSIGFSANAQMAIAQTSDNVQEKKPNELTKLTLLKLQNDFSLSHDKLGNSYAIFEKYFTAKAAITNGLSASDIAQKQAQGGFLEIETARDKALELIYSQTELEKWKQVSTSFLKTIYASK